MRKIILASASKRRSEILSSCGIKHTVVPSRSEEFLDYPAHVSVIVQMNAIMKAEDVAEKYPDAVIIGADTLVLDGDKVIGKPRSEKEAKKLLKDFSGGELEVYTGVCVIDTGSSKKAAGVDMSAIKAATLAPKDVDKFFRLLGPYDKAGGFSIEGVGSMLFDNIIGSYFNILGLPMTELRDLFSEVDLDILDFVEG
jgi:septum formation protein